LLLGPRLQAARFHKPRRTKTAENLSKLVGISRFQKVYESEGYMNGHTACDGINLASAEKNSLKDSKL